SILILDEPTSALDPETEAALVRAVRAASRERIVLVVTHRLSTAVEADQIVFLEDGRVVERGTHAALLARPVGAYRRCPRPAAGGGGPRAGRGAPPLVRRRGGRRRTAVPSLAGE